MAPVLLPGLGPLIPSLPERASGALHLPWDCDTSRLEGEMLATPWKILGPERILMDSESANIIHQIPQKTK